MSKTLGTLVAGALDLAPEVAALDISGISADSRTVKPGYVFAALSGTQVRGLDFAEMAVKNGAVVIVADANEVGDADFGVPVLEVEDARGFLSHLAAAFYGAQPDCVAAVTGTNGKSSIVSFVRQIWESMGLMAASLGTIGVEYRGGYEKLGHTTPDPVRMHEVLAGLSDKGINHLAIEASSHGLEQRRLDGLGICVGAFTNLTRDHLDYHETFEAYFDAKMRLFRELLMPGSAAIINADSDYADKVSAIAKDAGLWVFSVGAKGRGIRQRSRELLDTGQLLELEVRGRRYKVFLPLVGAFQAENALVAAGMVIASGGSPEVVMGALENLKGARGRLERVAETATGASVYVDYAHTPDALKVALETLRPFTRNRLVVAFGCGGDRDQEKRPQMGKIAAQLADVVIVTDDNPRTEEPAAIRSAILAAAPEAREIGDRAEAIRVAINELERGDVLLVAGKGHELGQVVGDKELPFSDHDVIAGVVGKEAA